MSGSPSFKLLICSGAITCAFVGSPMQLDIDLFFGDRIGPADPIDSFGFMLRAGAEAANVTAVFVLRRS
jgi:hypothetical protein